MNASLRCALLLATLLLAGTAPPARALDRWTWQDTAWEASYLAVGAADWAQTMRIATARRHYDWGDCRSSSYRYTEVNPLLGRHPSPERVNATFAASALVHVAISRTLPSRYRRGWQIATTAIEAAFVTHNLQIGITF